MHQAALPITPDQTELFDTIATALERDGYLILPTALPPELTQALLMRVIDLDAEEFRRAGIGRDQALHLNDFVRTDEVRWLGRRDPAEAAFLEWMEGLRLGLNRRLFLGLFDYESHFARYTPGAYYKRHVDAFRGDTNRVVTTVFYLNPGWELKDGGELLIYRDAGLEPMHKVLPLFGTLVVFMSTEFPHEVAVAHRERYSIAGWFRVNNSVGGTVDPPR